MESRPSATCERKTWRFWSWLFGYRVLWILVFGLPTLDLGGAWLTDIQFFVDARPLRGHVATYGVDTEDVGLSGRYVGPWSQSNPVPWVDITFSEGDGVAMPCRIRGQADVFGDWISEDRETVERELRRHMARWQLEIAFHRSDQLDRCAVGKDIDWGRLLVLLPFLLLTIGFSVATVRALRNGCSGRSSS